VNLSYLTCEDKGSYEDGTPVSTFPLENTYFLLKEHNILCTIYCVHTQMSSRSSSGKKGGTRFKAIYVPPDWEETWKEFGEICRREGESVSHKILRLMEQYVAAHRKGNPQLLLDRFLSNRVLVAGRCFLCGGRDVEWVGSYRRRDGALRLRLLCDSCKRACAAAPHWVKFERIQGAETDEELEGGE